MGNGLAMTCAACTAEVPDEDAFCEICGAPLSGAAPERAGCPCGAETDQTDEDGFCLRCGRRVRRPPSDHIEVALSAALAGVSDRGQRHEKNEDRFALVHEANGVALVVCDGVSSTRDAEVASQTVAATMQRELGKALRQELPLDSPAAIDQAIFAAAKELRAQAGDAGLENTPSTTVVAALVHRTEITVGWRGDSRAYWIDGDGGVLVLTRDHSWLNDVVARGEMSEADALGAPQAHAITRWVGADAEEDLRAEIVHHTVRGEGVLLLCTDGLWNYAAEPEALGELFRRCGGPATDALPVARAMVDFANGQGGRDNITVALLRLRSGDTPGAAEPAVGSGVEPQGDALRTKETEDNHGGAVQSGHISE